MIQVIKGEQNMGKFSLKTLVLLVAAMMLLPAGAFAAASVDTDKIAVEVINPDLYVTQAVVYTLEHQLTASEEYTVRIDLSGAVFGGVNAPEDGDLVYVDVAGGVVTATIAVSEIEEGYVVYTVVPSADTSVDDTLTFTFKSLPVAASSKVSAAVTVAKSGLSIESDSVVAYAATPGSTSKFGDANEITIDVAAEKTKFENDSTTATLGTLTTAITVSDVKGLNMMGPDFTLNGTDEVTLTVKGDFSAVIKDADGELDPAGLYFVAADDTSTAATTLTASEATFVFDGDEYGALNDAVLKMEVDGETIIAEGSILATAELNMDSDNDEVVSVENDRTLFADQTVATLSYNGTIAYAGMVAGSGNAGWGGGFRIVNRTSLAAPVHFQCQAVNGGEMTEDATYTSDVPANQSVFISADAAYATCGLPNTTTGNIIVSVEASSADIFQTSTTPSGHTIIPLTKSNNQ